MEEAYQLSNFRSAWRPLNRENDLSKISTCTYSGVETLKKNGESLEITAGENRTSEQSDILKKLTEISADINTLNHMLSDRMEKMDNLFSLLEEKEATGKKNVFGLQRK